MNKTEQRELDALLYAGVPCMPEPVSEQTPVWIRAIARVLMNNLSTGYAIVRNEFSGTPKIEKIFGDAAVARFESIHPYLFLDMQFVPNLSNEKEAKSFVRRVYGVDAKMVNGLSKEKVADLIFAYCAKRQLAGPTVNRDSEKEEQNEE